LTDLAGAIMRLPPFNLQNSTFKIGAAPANLSLFTFHLLIDEHPEFVAPVPVLDARIDPGGGQEEVRAFVAAVEEQGDVEAGGVPFVPLFRLN
jgi:hypothetical protein